MGEVFSTIATITGTEIKVGLVHHYAGKVEAAWSEARPANLADADTALAAHSMRRMFAWDLGENGTVQARVRIVDNWFNGVVAARLEGKLGTTHQEIGPMSAGDLQDGDLVSSGPAGEPLYVVAGSSIELGEIKVHMVGEGQTWDDRHTTSWPVGAFVWAAPLKR